MLNLSVFLLVGSLVFHCHGGKVPFVTPCRASDEACLISSSQKVLPYLTKGVPDLGIAPADPLVLDDVKATEGDLTMHFKNLTVTGLDGCKIAKMKITDDHTHISLVLECPINSVGQYAISGKLLFIPIEGNGDVKLKLDKVGVSIEAQLKKVDGADGVKHFHASHLKYTYEPLGPVHIHLDNLFGGDETKAKPVADVLNGSSNEVFLTFGKPIVKEFVAKAKDCINNFFMKIPADEMFLY